MVDSINNSNNSIGDLQSSQLGASQQIAKANLAAANQKDGISQLIDMADISDAAKARMNAEKSVMKFVKEINQQEEDFDTDKVTLFKNMLDSGKINQYLSSLSNDSLADSLLNSPMAVAFNR